MCYENFGLINFVCCARPQSGKFCCYECFESYIISEVSIEIGAGGNALSYFDEFNYYNER